jgi:hypothetical protein
MKKYISLCLAIILCLSFALSVEAKSENTYYYNGVEIIFEENSILSEDMKYTVAEALVSGNIPSDELGTYAMLCLIVGHNYSTEIVGVTQHKIDPDEPRCLMQTWELQICTVCEDMIPTLLTERYIFCCPEE